MKKTIIFLLSVLLIVCVACGKSKAFPADIKCEQILNAATAAVSYENTTIHIKDKNNLDTYDMAMWADGVFDECSEFDLISDYAICYSADNTTYEISVLKAKSKDDVQKVTELLQRRKQTLQGGVKAAYDPDFEKLMQNSKILSEGEFVILLITADNTSVLTAIDNLKQ